MSPVGTLLRLAPLFLLLLLGCAGRLPGPPAFQGPPEAALGALASSSPGEGAVTTTTRIVIDRQGERYPLKVAVMMQRPASLRVEAIPLMGPPDFYLSISGGELRVFLPRAGAFYTGRATPANLLRFLGVSLPAADLVSLLMGMPPDRRDPASSLRGGWEEGLYRIDQEISGEKTESLWIDPGSGRLARVQRFPGKGIPAYQADFADPVPIGAGFLPQQLTIREGDGTVLTLRHADPRLIEVDRDSFSLDLPEGIAVTPLDP